MATSVIKLKNNGAVKKAKAFAYGLVKITKKNPTVKINQTLPFRVKFTTVQIPGYGPNNPAPIGIAVIGFSNYIL
jgi:hypothetical protein